jgi:hypothetical protein
VNAAFARILSALHDHGSVVQKNGDGQAKATCPSHRDHTPSLSIGPRTDGRGVVVFCHAGCDYRDVLTAIKLHPRDLFDDDGLRAVYAPTRDYTYPDGRQVHRKPNKSFPQSGNTKGTALFHADRIGDTPRAFWPEGEKDVEAIEAVGGFAVCSATGAGKAHLCDPEPVRDKHVIVIADRDRAGYKHAAQVAEIVRPIAASVTVVEAATGKDAADHIAAGLTLDELVPVPEDVLHAAGSTGSTGFDGSNVEGVLNRVREWLGRFICPMDPRDLDLLALWFAHTHLVDETYTTPRLLIESPVPEAGKTTVIEHAERLCAHPLQMATVSSPAMITRMLQKSMRTILIDEADRALNPDKPGIDDLMAVLNSGYKKGATRPVLVPTKGGGWDAVEMPTYSPVAMAGNQPKLPDDTLSRTIRVLIMPDHEGTVDDSDWELIEPEAKTIANDLASWADLVCDQVRNGPRPSLPEGAKARTKERWLPLKRVAVAAGDRWPGVVDELIELDLERMRLERDEGMQIEKPHVTLLRHIAEVWVESDAFHSTDDLLAMLVAKHPLSWGASEKYPKGLTAQRMGRMLVKNFAVYSSRTSIGARGYFAKSFDRALRSVRMTPLYEPSKPVDPDEPTTERCSTSAYSKVTGEGRCEECSFHIPTQGHRDTCQQTNGGDHAGKPLCRDCNKRPRSAGRPRCNECHAAFVQVRAGYDT